MKYVVSNEKVQFQKGAAEMKAHPEAEMNLVKIYPEIQEQEIRGFGGAVTEAAAYVYSRLGAENQRRIMELYFGETGNNYNLGRLTIQSCDFSLGNRAYVEEGDAALTSFSIAGDEAYQIPFIQEALSKNAALEFMASPWSPPAFMKSNGDMNHGGALLEQYYAAWARLMVKYLLAYQEKGIRIWRITVQNEPAACQTWDSCLYTGTQEAVFAVHYLRRELDAAGLDKVKIFIWDHNKDSIIERCRESFAVEGAADAIDGIAYHWYSGDHFEALDYVHRKYPDKELAFTEGCVEYSRFADKGQIDNAEMYAHNMIGDFKAGMDSFYDWNLLLDEKGGPNHVGNFCDAPIMCNTKEDRLEIKLSYYYIGHFSRYIQRGAKRLFATSYHKGLECVAFLNPDGSKTAVLLNATGAKIPFELLSEGKGAELELEAHSIMTVMMEAM